LTLPPVSKAGCPAERHRVLERRIGLGRSIHLADTPPAVLDQAAVLDFHGADAWAEFCSMNDLAVAPGIAREIVGRLNAAYMEEDSLASLLEEYRSVVRRRMGGGDCFCTAALIRTRPVQPANREAMATASMTRGCF